MNRPDWLAVLALIAACLLVVAAAFYLANHMPGPGPAVEER